MTTARQIILCWIDGLSDRQLLELRHAGPDWCAKIRAELRKMATPQKVEVTQ